jgi:hypothetical protein
MTLEMNEMVFKLPGPQIPQARREGGELRPDMGRGWVGLNPFAVPTDMPGARAKLSRWCRAAQDGATSGP